MELFQDSFAKKLMKVQRYKIYDNQKNLSGKNAIIHIFRFIVLYFTKIYYLCIAFFFIERRI